MRVLDLFSGVGGMSLGLERAGMQTVAFCEIEPYCRRVLARHWPEVPIYDDVRSLTAARLAADGIVFDLIAGGFPCQDLSVAGKGAGLGGERSSLWFEYHRLIAEARPTWALIENVPALRSRGLEVVLGGLAALGYDAEWDCVPASALGARHRRDRLWLVAYADGGQRVERFDALRPGRDAAGRCGEALAHAARHGAGEQAPAGSIGERIGPRGAAGGTRDVPDADGIGGSPGPLHAGEGARGRHVGGGGFGSDAADTLRLGPQGGEPARSSTGSGRRLADAGAAHVADASEPGLPLPAGEQLRGPGRGSEGGATAVRGGGRPEPGLGGVADGTASRLDGASDRRVIPPPSAAMWAEEPDIPRVARGVLHRVPRLRALGNAVVPQIPEMLGRRIMAAAGRSA